ncbi:efflux RND transporter periplasmic adaptor subunit [Parapedobacter sp. 10938]|uniref:efflux RND transporter periplasmic adaptor subunit n=1 Tax=Parapedobacter flavus TaxID=3110225 RepID=UPI002DB59131|nr:efflux RND transporter periplasmic adaptor subunit [Parapedobacter sp. 10938]MEC3878840.1 efflux RND transporter periplasmic adaptor subunit [Parapedobacter sp. 10938]
MNTYNYYFLGVALMMAVAACSSGNHDSELPADDTVIPVRVQPLAATDTAGTVTATGTFTTDDETALAFRGGGIIQQLRVKEGQAFRRGQLLAAVESTEMNTALEQAQLGLEKAERDYHRAQQLYADSVATLEQLENAKTAFDAATQDVERASYLVSHTVITAPFDGYVLQRPANVGQVVGPGTPVLVVASSAKGGWLLKVGVSDRQWSAIHVGNAATVTTDALPGKELRAEVVRKSEGIDPLSGVFNIYLKLADAPSSSLASGLFGRAAIHLAQASDVWLIPYEALMDGDGGKAYVFITADGQTARRVPVEVSGIQQDHAVVTAGLEDGGSLIVSGSPYLRNGSSIIIK